MLDDPHRRAARHAFDVLGEFTLDLEANFDDFEGIGEDLFFCQCGLGALAWGEHTT
jgi:hypothetical protein